MRRRLLEVQFGWLQEKLRTTLSPRNAMTTAFVYDPFERNHTFPGHPECYQRMESTWALLEADGILDTIARLPNSAAPLEPIVVVHSAHYVEHLRAICQDIGQSDASAPGAANNGNAAAMWLDQDTYALSSTWEAALRAAGGLLNITDAVMTGAANNGFAMVRPPGHHARPHTAKGFCLFGNVAIAARRAQQEHGAERVLIVDFDVHHGNGTAEMFYDDPSVLFISIHQYPHYPFSGGIDEIGRDTGEGFTVNVPSSRRRWRRRLPRRHSSTGGAACAGVRPGHYSCVRRI